MDEFDEDSFDENLCDEPATDVGGVKPTSLSHLIGQRTVIEQVKVALDAAQMDANKMDSALLVGPPGLGKSALAQVIAQEMATDFHEVLGQSVKTPADLNALLLAAKDKDVIHIDEAHELRREYQTALCGGCCEKSSFAAMFGQWRSSASFFTRAAASATS